MFKRTVTVLFCLFMLALIPASCAHSFLFGSGDTKMQYMTADETEKILGAEGYTLIDLRKPEDYAAGHIPGAISISMDAAVKGDAEAGKAAMKAGIEGINNTLVLVCYAGKRYAQAGTNALAAIGYDMSKVFTLEGGFGNWSKVKPAIVETKADAEKAAKINVVNGTVAFNIDMSGYEAGKPVKVWVPVASTNERQTVDNVVFSAETAAVAELHKDEQGNSMLYVEWGADAAPASRKAAVSFHVSRPEIVAPKMVESGVPGSDMDVYLKASSTIPVDGDVKALADTITTGETTYLGKARAVYEWVIANMNRDNDVRGCGLGIVPELLSTLRGKCTDINSVFVGLCRAAGVPAREMFGVRMNAADITGNQHCWAEFYLPGTGWVLADPADVLKAVLTNKWDKSQAEALAKQEFYWGNCEAERVELSRGRDLTLSPAQEGPALNNFGYPYAEVGGMIIDCWAPADFVYSITFKAD